MPQAPPIRYTPLHESDVLRIEDYVCQARAGGPASEEESTRDAIVLLRNGAFQKHRGRDSAVATVCEAAFFGKGASARISHPVDCGDRGTVFLVARSTLLDIVREYDPEKDDHSAALFPFMAGPCATDVYRDHLALVRRMPETPSRDPLDIDERALDLVSRVVRAAFERQGLRGPARRRRTGEDHRDRVAVAQAFLAREMRERVTLADVGRAAGLSPFHCARVFREVTGASMHRYLNELRLRSAAAALADGARDITEVALAHGFAAHAHFTEAFRRAFGVTPSAWRASH